MACATDASAFRDSIHLANFLRLSKACRRQLFLAVLASAHDGILQAKLLVGTHEHVILVSAPAEGGRVETQRAENSVECRESVESTHLVQSLYTCTALVWPMRWHLAIAWTSFCGFQSGSKTITYR